MRISFALMVLFFVLQLLLLLLPPAFAGRSIIDLLATKDASLSFGGDEQDTNFGLDELINLATQNVGIRGAIGFQNISRLPFWDGSASSIISAELILPRLLSSTDSLINSECLISINPMKDNWDETGITANNRPEVNFAQTFTVQNTARGVEGEEEEEEKKEDPISNIIGNLGGGNKDDPVSSIIGNLGGGNDEDSLSSIIGNLGGGNTEDSISSIISDLGGGNTLQTVSSILGRLGSGVLVTDYVKEHLSLDVIQDFISFYLRSDVNCAFPSKEGGFPAILRIIYDTPDNVICGDIICGPFDSEACCDDLLHGPVCYNNITHACLDTRRERHLLCGRYETLCGLKCHNPRYSTCLDDYSVCTVGWSVCNRKCFNPLTHDCLDDAYICPKGHRSCNGACYNPRSYECFGKAMCPAGMQFCGSECYSPRKYTCRNDFLTEIGRKDTHDITS